MDNRQDLNKCCYNCIHYERRRLGMITNKYGRCKMSKNIIENDLTYRRCCVLRNKTK